MRTKEKGDVAVANALAYYLGKGKAVLLPFGDNARYDLALDLGQGKIERLQVKTGWFSRGCLRYNIASHNSKGPRRGKRRKYSIEEIEAFVVYYPPTGNLYKVPVSEATGTLRLTLAVNKQTKGVRWASDYEVEAL